MKQRDIFLRADAAVRDVIDRLTPEQLRMSLPADWSGNPGSSIRDAVASMTEDEAWVPDVLAGRTIEEVGERWSGDLLGDDPVAAYDAVHDRATAAVKGDLDAERVVHLSYGDFPTSEFLEHTLTFRGFQAWSIAKAAGIEYSLPPELVDGLWDTVVPQLDFWRSVGVFGPEVEVPEGADKQTRLLGLVGFWRE
jgi:uncharacterized protein (TIGR03086 family)